MADQQIDFTLRPIGVIRSPLKERSQAPRQGSEGAPDVWVEIDPVAAEGLEGLVVGQEVIVLTWLHQARRETLKVYPRTGPKDPAQANTGPGRGTRLMGVFATRSPDRPNPVGLHRVTVRAIEKGRILLGPMEAIDGTPVLDIKPVLTCSPGS